MTKTKNAQCSFIPSFMIYHTNMPEVLLDTGETHFQPGSVVVEGDE